MDDKTLQKAQLKQHKIFQNFPTSPAPLAPNAPSLPGGTNPEVSPLLEPNDSDNNSPETILTPKLAILPWTLMIILYHRLILAKKSIPTHYFL